MKRICLMIVLLALLLPGCAESEPATVATISPGPDFHYHTETADFSIE